MRGMMGVSRRSIEVRRCNVVMFLDYDGPRLNGGGRRIRPCQRCPLQCRDDSFAYTLAMESDDVGDFEPPLHAVLVDVIDDQWIA